MSVFTRYRALASRAGLALPLAILAVAVALAGAARAQDPYPSKPIRLLVGYPPGGSVDMAARVVAEVLTAQLKATVVVDNQSGAAGTIAAQRVVSSPADGYTLLVGSSNELAATGQVNLAQKYDPLRDVTPIGLVATAPVLLVAHPRMGVKTVDEFIQRAARNPGKYSYGSSGVGSTLHFAGALIEQQAGVSLAHIPYRGTAALTTDLVGGALDFAMISPTAAAPFLQNGRLVALGVTSAKRMSFMPNVPALAEHPKLQGYELIGWFAVVAPKGLPADMTQRLRTALAKGLQDPAVRKRLDEGGSVPASGNEDLGRLMRDDAAKFAQLVKFADIKE